MEWDGCVSGLAAVALVVLFILTASGAFLRGAWRETGKWMRRRPWWIWWPLTVLVWWPACLVDSALWLLFTDRPKPIEQRTVREPREWTEIEAWMVAHTGYQEPWTADMDGTFRMMNDAAHTLARRKDGHWIEVPHFDPDSGQIIRYPDGRSS